ncbi:MAG: substrate-binding domain-containing protein [Armatimonadetes bacterium]|nr:substrate-binding domain-containing protein [Armatimonadota bacterium]
MKWAPQLKHARPATPLILVLAGVTVAALGGCPQPRPLEVTINTSTSGAPTSRQEILAQARRERELDWYTSLPAPDAQAIAHRFMRKYPFITCRVTRSSTFEIVQRIQREIERGQVIADVLHVLDTGVFVNLQQSGQLYRYESAESKSLPRALRAPGYWAACRVVVTALAVREGEGLKLKAWSDLVSLPRDVAIGIKDAETSGSAYATYYLLRDKYGYSFWERLAARKVRIYRSEVDMLAGLRRQEVDVLAGIMVEPASREPGVRLIWPVDGAPVVLGPIALLAAAPHPNAGKLFLDFVLSREGQALLRDVSGGYPAREDLDPPRGLPPLNSMRVLWPRTRWELYTALQDTLQAEYHDLFRPSGE